MSTTTGRPVLPPEPEPPRWRRWPDAASPFGALFYAVLGGLMVWLLVDVLPHHLVIGWH